MTPETIPAWHRKLLASEGDRVFSTHRARVLAPRVRLKDSDLWSALHHHGLTDQAPRKVFVLTTTDALVPRARGRKNNEARGGFPVEGISYQFVQVKPERFFGRLYRRSWVPAGSHSCHIQASGRD